MTEEDKLDLSNNTQEEDIEGEKEFEEFIARRDRARFPEDKLEEIFRMQRLFADEIEKSLRFPQHPIEQIKFLCIALSHEVNELQDHTNWKWWKKPKKFNEAEAKEELIDIFHFVIHTALVLNMTADDFIKEYEKKMEINKQRQREGY